MQHLPCCGYCEWRPPGWLPDSEVLLPSVHPSCSLLFSSFHPKTPFPHPPFPKIIKIYLDILGFKNISPLNSDDNKLTDFKCISNTDSILVSCAQNSLYGKEAKDEDDWETTGRPEIQSFLARMYINDCKKGIFITNSYFSDLAIEFVDNFNNKNQDVEIKLINGYELTKSIRNHKYYILKKELLNETKYNI